MEYTEFLQTKVKTVQDSGFDFQESELSDHLFEFQKYASPVWYDINYSDTLQFRTARHENDEKHICPLQLQTIERAIHLWTNQGDTVLSPFMGIGSEGYQALKMNRKFIGVELKESYFNLACKNMEMAIKESNQLSLFTA